MEFLLNILNPARLPLVLSLGGEVGKGLSQQGKSLTAFAKGDFKTAFDEQMAFNKEPLKDLANMTTPAIPAPQEPTGKTQTMGAVALQAKQDAYFKLRK